MLWAILPVTRVVRRSLPEVRRRTWILVALVVVGGFGAYLGTEQGSTYRATASVRVGSAGADVTGQRFLTTLLAAEATDPSLLAAAGDIAPPGVRAADVAARTADGPGGTLVLRVSVTAGDPLAAESRADALVGAIVAGSEDVPAISAATSDAGLAHLLSAVPATIPTTPHVDHLLRNVVLGASIGLIVGLALIGLSGLVRGGETDIAGIERVTGLRVLSTIPRRPGLPGRLVTPLLR